MKGTLLQRGPRRSHSRDDARVATQDSSLEQIQARLDKLAALFPLSQAIIQRAFPFLVWREKLKETLSIVEEMLFKPAFHHEDFEESKRNVLKV